MNAAAFAAMSDPECNRNFSRRWAEADAYRPTKTGVAIGSPAAETVGEIVAWLQSDRATPRWWSDKGPS